jgi:hypothetical protein
MCASEILVWVHLNPTLYSSSVITPHRKTELKKEQNQRTNQTKEECQINTHLPGGANAYAFHARESPISSM